MRHVLQGISFLVVCRKFDRAAPTHGAEVHHAVGIGDLSAIYLDRIIMKSFVQRTCMAVPRAILAFLEFGAVSERASNAIRIRRNDAELHAALRADLWIFLSWLVG